MRVRQLFQEMLSFLTVIGTASASRRILVISAIVSFLHTAYNGQALLNFAGYDEKNRISRAPDYPNHNRYIDWQLFAAFFVKITITFAVIFYNFLKFIIPLIIVRFIIVGDADLGKGTGKLAVTTRIARSSTFVAGMPAYIVKERRQAR